MRFENTRRFLELSGVKKEDTEMIIKDLNDALEEAIKTQQEDLYKVIKAMCEGSVVCGSHKYLLTFGSFLKFF